MGKHNKSELSPSDPASPYTEEQYVWSITFNITQPATRIKDTTDKNVVDSSMISYASAIWFRTAVTEMSFVVYALIWAATEFSK